MADILKNYVKFVRGTTSAYANLKVKDNDTLYFIYNENEASGKLYLGERLIAGDVNSNSSLSDLKDIVITEAKANQILTYDEVQGKWINQDLSNNTTLISSIVEKLTTPENISKIAPVFNGTKSGLVPVSAAEVKGNLLLTDLGTWVSVPSGTLTPVQSTAIDAATKYLITEGENNLVSRVEKIE